MDLPIEHASFVNRRLALRPAGWFKGPQLLHGGSPVSGKRMKYEARDDQGRARQIQLKGRFLDPLPVLAIDGEAIELGRPLKWYEYVWMGIPVVLVVTGGALGGALGFMAAYSSARIFRGERSTVAKYALSALISFTATVVFIVVAGAIQLAIG